jgi:hypothetical protein
MTKIERALAFLILFVGGYSSALPVADLFIEVPAIFTPIQVVHGVFLRDVLVMLFISIYVLKGSLPKIRLLRREIRFAVLVFALGFAGILSTVINVTSLLDVGEAMRLFVFGAYFCLALYSARILGPAFLLRSYLLGILVGGIINLYYTFEVRFIVIGTMPLLLGQNGPGGVLALAVPLGAWLGLIHTKRWDTVVAAAASGVGLFATSISYSRLAILMATCGVIAWSVVVIGASTGRQSRLRGLVLATLGSIALLYLIMTPTGREYGESIQGFFDRKFDVIDVNDINSVGARYQYFLGVYEILKRNPLGVGYSGFYDAIVETRGSLGTYMLDEEHSTDASQLANPHSAFLYYISANGYIGLIVAIGIFAIFVATLYKALAQFGRRGIVVWACVSAAFLVNALTLPTLFNTEALYLSAALAFSLSPPPQHAHDGHRQTRLLWSELSA